MQEIWKDIPNYEGLYQVSNLGRVKVLDRYVNSGIKNNNKVKRKSRILKQHNKQGYFEVTLIANNKRKYYKVHRLVAQAFIPNPNNYQQVNHKDENKLNNCVDNLEWCDAKYNCNYGLRNDKIHKNTRSTHIRINQYDLSGNFIRTYNSYNEASRIIGKSPVTIRRYCSNITHDKNYIWRDAN